MKWLIHMTLAALVTACGSPAERAAERALREGEAPYRAGDYSIAAPIYADGAPDPRAIHNLGNALFEQALLDTAIRVYEKAVAAGTEGPVRSGALYNLGTAWAEQALRADSLADESGRIATGMRIEGQDIGQRVRQFVVRDSLQQEHGRLEHLVDSALHHSLGAYKNALRLAPADEHARHNLAVVQRLIAQRVKEAADKAGQDPNKNKELSERAKLLMQQADSLVEEHKFTDALKLLQDGLRSEPSLQQQQEYMHKLDIVTKAAQAK